MKQKVTVGGTSKAFSKLTPINVSHPDFYSSFENDKFELIPEFSCEYLIAFNHEPS